LADKSWRESEDKFKQLLDTFFGVLKLSDLKKWDDYKKGVPEHF